MAGRRHRLLCKRFIQIGLFSTCAFIAINFECKALAQSVVAGRPGLISFIVGDVYLEGRQIHIKSQEYPFLNENQLLRTMRGRVEMQLTPDVFLRLGEEGELRFARESQGGIQVLLQKGAAIVEAIKIAKSNRIQIQCAGSNTEVLGKGVYRFDADPGRLRVYGGKAEIFREDMKAHAESGKAVDLANALVISKFSVKSADSLHLWAARRSFYLFISNPEALAFKTHWELTVSGQSRNTDFHIRLFSPIIAREYAKKQFQEEKDQATSKAIQDHFRYEDEKELYERQQELLRQQQEQQKQQQQQNKKQ